MVVDREMLESLREFWDNVASDDLWKDSISVDFDCGDTMCLYSALCHDSSTGMRKIGKWCPYYAEKLVEFLNN